MTISPDTLETLRGITAATVSMQLVKRGIRRCWIEGPKSIHPPGHPAGGRLVGEAFTLRFVPLREDLGTLESYAKSGSIRDAIEAMPAGSIAVIDACGETRAAVLGDILAGRMQKRGVLGAVSDGPVRDLAAIRDLGFPVFCGGSAAPPSIAGLVFAGWQEPVGCGGVAVLPGDVVIGDEDGWWCCPKRSPRKSRATPWSRSASSASCSCALPRARRSRASIRPTTRPAPPTKRGLRLESQRPKVSGLLTEQS
jgi:regulator of RNase E activity RraA